MDGEEEAGLLDRNTQREDWRGKREGRREGGRGEEEGG